MKNLFLVCGLSIFSTCTFSQELKVSNERTAVAAPGQTETPASGQNAGTLTVRSTETERAMNALPGSEQSTENNETTNTSLTGGMVAGPTERATSEAIKESSNQTKINTTGKPK